MKFDNIYSHAPVTNKALTSLLCSIYPWPSYRHLTQEHSAIDLPALPNELKKHGYRTSLFYSADLTFQGAENFLAGRGFDLVQDYKTRACPEPPIVASTERWPYQDMSNDRCTAEALLDWVGADPATPFFAMMWTNMTHYPYFPAGDEIDFGVGDESLHRYLNALRHTDRVVGHVLRTLRARGLAESTLVVIVGDHGEAFGRHDQMGHSSKIYEENVHVPLIFVAPATFAGETNASVGGLVDLAPTILELLGRPLPGEWQGRSLLAENRSGRTYFFSPWSDLLFGLRDGDLKLIYNASNDSYEVYDLSTDRYEERDVAGRHSKFREQGLDRLAAWVQFQETYIARAIERGRK
jgi:arylsulfatase A-like enzyme